MKKSTLTKKRKSILDLLKQNHLMTAKEICQALPHIDRATVYRGLEFLVRNGLVRELKLEKSAVQYELYEKETYHQHFFCTKCNKVFPIQMDMKSIKELITEPFTIEDFELNVKGLCAKCITC